MTYFINLVTKAQQGEHAAFETLYKELYTPVFKYVLSRTRHKETAEDITSDVFLRFYTSIENYESQKDSPLAYLYTIAKNLIINNGKKKKTENFEEGVEENIPDESRGALDSLVTREESDYIISLLEELPDDQAEVIRLKFLSELTTKEVAQILQKSEANIRKIESRGLQKIRTMVEEKQL